MRDNLVKTDPFKLGRFSVAFDLLLEICNFLDELRELSFVFAVPASDLGDNDL